MKSNWNAKGFQKFEPDNECRFGDGYSQYVRRSRLGCRLPFVFPGQGSGMGKFWVFMEIGFMALGGAGVFDGAFHGPMPKWGTFSMRTHGYAI